MGQDAVTSVLEFDTMELPYRATVAQETIERRRLMTLIVPQNDDKEAHGGVGRVLKTRNALGETIAVKQLHFTAADNPTGMRARASLKHEYNAQRLATASGFVPKIYGYGTSQGTPAILMEWVEGTTLKALMREFATQGKQFTAAQVADIGISVLAALEAIASVDSRLTHRDISPANIILRTTMHSVNDQLQSGVYDICLIDFGSASVNENADASFTVAESLWRGATPEYTAPEMLGRDDPTLTELRHSPAIDIYALCSVLYELYAGKTPYRLAEQTEAHAYHLKSGTNPYPLVTRKASDAGLVATIASGLSRQQEMRPSRAELMEALTVWQLEAGSGRSADIAVATRRSVTTQTSEQTDEGTHLIIAERAHGNTADSSESIHGNSTRRRFLVGTAVTLVGIIGAHAALSTLQRSAEQEAIPKTDGMGNQDYIYPKVAVRMNDSDRDLSIEYKYDSDGRLMNIVSTWADGVFTGKHTFAYDYSGRLLMVYYEEWIWESETQKESEIRE